MIRLFVLAGLSLAVAVEAAPTPCDTGPKAIQQWKGYDARHPQFRKVTHLAVASSGSVYLLDQELNLIREFSSEGAFLQTWELPESEFIVAMAASDSFLYISDGHCTFQLFRNGSIATWHRGAAHNGLATDKDGNVYLSTSLVRLKDLEVMKKHLRTDYYQAVRDSLTNQLGIWKLSSQGETLRHWSAPAWPITMDTRGILFAVEPDSGGGVLRISKEKPELRSCRMGLERTMAFRCFAIGPEGHFFVNDRHAVVETDEQGNVLRRWCDPGSTYDLIRTPSGLSVDGRGYLYVADYSNSRVLKFDLNAP